MSDQKKPKINLKDRLAKGGGAAPAGGGAIPVPPGVGAATPAPPPVGSGPGEARDSGLPAAPVINAPPAIAPPPSIRPSNIAPPANLAGGISLPSFQPRQAPKKEVVSAEAQTIKVEVGEEVIAQRKKGVRNVMIGSIVAAGIGFAIGFLAGGGNEASNQKKAQLNNAAKLLKPVKSAVEKVTQLAGFIGKTDPKSLGIADSILQQTYPEDAEISKLNLNIDFDDKTINGIELPAESLTLVLKFKAACDTINEKKDYLRNLLGGSLKAELTGAWDEFSAKGDPPYTQAILFHAKSEQFFAELGTLDKPLAAADKWPDAFTIITKRGDPNQPGVVQPVTNSDKKRYQKGDVASDQSMLIVPPPKSHDKIDESMAKITTAVQSLKDAIYGVQRPSAQGGDIEGLISRGEGSQGVGDKLVAKLTEIDARLKK